MPRETCCGTSVGAIVVDAAGRMLMVRRAWHPTGWAPVAGHIADHHTDPLAAAKAETAEETGLTPTGVETVAEGWWLPNLCAAPPAAIPGHRWWIVRVRVAGELAPDPIETEGADWWTPEQVADLAERTIAHAYGVTSPEEFTGRPGLEPVWVEILDGLGLLGRDKVTTRDLTQIRRLYSTPPDSYWTGEQEVPAGELAAERVVTASWVRTPS